MKHRIGYVFFYAVTTIPAYFLIYFGLVGNGILQTYSSYYTPFLNYVPSQQFSLYFILIGSLILFGVILNMIKKLNHDLFDELKEFLKLKSGLHTTHCEFSGFLTYFGIGAIVVLLTMYFIWQISVVNNLIVLFGIALISGTGAVIYYRHEHSKWPF